MTDDPLYIFLVVFRFHLFMLVYFTWRTASIIRSVCEVNWFVLLRTSARRSPTALCAVVFLADTVRSFELLSLDMRFGANEAPGEAVRLRQGHPLSRHTIRPVFAGTVPVSQSKSPGLAFSLSA